MRRSIKEEEARTVRVFGGLFLPDPRRILCSCPRIAAREMGGFDGFGTPHGHSAHEAGAQRLSPCGDCDAKTCHNFQRTSKTSI